MRVKQRRKIRGRRKKNEKGVEIGKETDHSGPGVRDATWIPREGYKDTYKDFTSGWALVSLFHDEIET